MNKVMPEVKPKTQFDQAIRVKAEIKIATLNLQGGGNEGAADKIDEITDFMEKEDIDVMCLQETKRPHNDVIRKGDYIFVFASNITNASKKDREEKFQFKNNKGKKREGNSIQDHEPKGKGHGKGKRKKDDKKETEWHGVGIAYKANLEKCRHFYKQSSSREISIQFEARGSPLRITNVYAPQSGRPPNERIKFFHEL